MLLVLLALFLSLRTNGFPASAHGVSGAGLSSSKASARERGAGAKWSSKLEREQAKARSKRVVFLDHRAKSRRARLSKGRRRRRRRRAFFILFSLSSLSPNYLPSIVLANSEASAQLKNFSPVIG